MAPRIVTPENPQDRGPINPFDAWWAIFVLGLVSGAVMTIVILAVELAVTR